MKKYKSLTFKLFFWYVISLLLLGFFIILTVHIYQYEYSIQVLAVLFFILSVIGFITIYRITRSLTDLSLQIRQISSKNLEKRILSIKSNDEIVFEKGLHRFLWPLSINDENTLITDIPLLHYSFINYEVLFDKLLYYKETWNDTVEKMMPLFNNIPKFRLNRASCP